VENTERCSIRTTVAEPAHAGLIGLRSRLPGLSGTANAMAAAPAVPLRPFYLARIFGADSKKSLHGNGLEFPMQRKLGGYSRPPWGHRCNLALWWRLV